MITSWWRLSTSSGISTRSFAHSVMIPKGGWIDDEVGYRSGAHKFAPGEYVSIHDDAEEVHTFRVTSVQPAL
jgi:hypothetical protein